MDIDEEMKKWSQTVYGVAHALHTAKSINLGNLNTILESLRAAEKWNATELGFASCLPAKEFKEGSIKLDGNSHEAIFQNVSESIVRILFINLTVLADEILGYLILKQNATPGNFLINKIQWSKPRIDSALHWSINGLLEMVAIRNALVHNGGRWNEATLAILREAGATDIDDSITISLSFADLFRYRRALRTLSGELAKSITQK